MNIVKFDKNAWLAKNGTNGNMRVTLIGQHNAAYSHDWAVFYEYQKTYGYFQLWSIFGNGGDNGKSARGAAKLMTDGKWHHVAVVYDEDSLTQTIYGPSAIAVKRSDADLDLPRRKIHDLELEVLEVA